MDKKITVLGKVKPTPRGMYDPEAVYTELDIIGYEGSSFIVREPFQGITPTDGNGYVSLLAAKGDKGDPLPFDEFTAEQKEALRGEPGAGLQIIAGFETLEKLKEAVPSPEPEHAYGVEDPEDPSTYNVHIYDWILGDWRNYGRVVGVPGKSAYEQYLEGGGTLSLTEFIAALSLVGNKVDKEEGKGLSSNDYTTGEKEKLAGIENEANRYIHPDDENIRHVTDGEKATWNGKAEGNHTHDDLYQPLGDYATGDHAHDGVYQPSGSYAAAGHDHDDVYQAKGNYQPAGSYAAADHNHSGTY
ncbi:MAG: hypothetical protein LIP08_03045 [Bacteroides sp.]|nr:hypothetical protein [Bacteroides sp.]